MLHASHSEYNYGLPMIQVVHIRDDIVANFWLIIDLKEELGHFFVVM